MIKALLGQIQGLFTKDFLFASFLPALIFCTAIGVSLAAILGVQATWAWVDSWTIMQKASASTVVGVAIVVFAYILNGLRAFVLRLWSGTISLLWPFFALGEALQRKRYRKLRERAHRQPQWSRLSHWFRHEISPHWNLGRPAIPAADLDSALCALDELDERASPDYAKQFISDKVTPLFAKYGGNSLATLYRKVTLILKDLEGHEQVKTAAKRARLDRRFGTFESIRGTALGNIVESYNVYPYKRYGMEAEIFWPHLQQVIKKEFMDMLRESRMVLDFSLAMASLGLLFLIISVFVGPWLWYKPALWLILGLVSVLSTVFFYQVAVFLAEQFGDLVRASFDLFRLDLLSALSRPHPDMLSTERQRWQQLSQLLVFGHVQDFELQARKP